jgi:microcystin-dependent protein
MEEFMGAIKYFPYTFAPAGWARCEGQLLTIRDNPALFSLLGTRFGGDGVNNFALPKIPPIEMEIYACICLYGIYPTRP